MHLRHQHIVNPIDYVYPSRLQDSLVRQRLDYKVLSPTLRAQAHNPAPTLLTFQTTPTYTCGRREVSTISSEQIAHLRNNGTAAFHTAQRGGQTTFHGPGQLTAYLIVDLREHKLTPRCYVRFLETSVIETCKRYGISSFTTENPGVWVSDGEKIASVGVHLRRNVTSHGIGLNISTDLSWFDRIVACGLPDKKTVNFEKMAVRGKGVDEVGGIFAEVVAEGMEGVEGVEKIELAEDLLK